MNTMMMSITSSCGTVKRRLVKDSKQFTSDTRNRQWEKYGHVTLFACVSIVVLCANVAQNASFLPFDSNFDSSYEVANISLGNLSSFHSSNHENIITKDSYITIKTSQEKPFCRRQQVHPGRWLPITLERPPYVSKTLHLRCQISDYDYDNPGPWPSWNWEPNDSSCELATWNASGFCDLLPFATVSVMGDSLSWEQYSSLIQLHGKRVHQSDQHASRLENRNVIYFACRKKNRGTKFVFRNDAQLKAETVANSINADFPMVLILNRGAHYVNDTELVHDMNELLPVLLNWQKSCTESYKRCHLFWRTTVPGHTMCEDYTAPVNNLTLMESLVKSRNNYMNEPIWNFHWQDFKDQNKLVLDIFRQYSETTGLQYEVIDGYELNILRPDRHRWHQNDCLHSCFPGKMDVYNQLLLHFLTTQRSDEDVQHMIDRFERFRSSQTSEQND